MFLVPQRQESPYTTWRSLLAAKGGFPDLSPSPKAASHPFKRKDKGIKGNPRREGCCARQGSRSNWRGAGEEGFLAFQMPSKQSIANWQGASSSLFNSTFCKKYSSKNTHSTSISLTSKFVLPYFVNEICAWSSAQISVYESVLNQIIARGSDLFCVWSSFCTMSRRALVCESSHSLCGLSRRAQFGVVVLRLLFEPSCSVWSRRAPGVSWVVVLKGVWSRRAPVCVVLKVLSSVASLCEGWT